MNTNNLKRFAREARIKLIDQVGRKLEFVLSNADPVFIDTNASQIQSLKNKIQTQGKEQVIDTVAYTWFNRLMALRFMDANGYTSPKVVTPVVGKSPEILQNALSGQIDENLKINRQRLNDLLDGKLVIADAQTEAYKMLLIASCNQWHSAMPFMFERISDYTELLLPDDLLSENSIITDIRNGMSDEDCGQEELIGWLYQFYIADKKDDVFEGLKKNIKITAENIPAATQLFTPRWIVRYMVENTLGTLWLTLKPNSKIRQFMPYYIEAPEGNAPAPLPEGIKGVTDITFLDPCQGSGHVLVYAFDLFTKIYEEEGFNTNEIPALILEHNLFGIDIDERAAQLAAFALTMKARSYFSRFLRKPVQPHVIALENVNEDIIKQAVKLPLAVAGLLVYDYRDLTLYNLTQADNFGSLIQIDPEELKALSIQKGSIWQEQEQKLKEQAEYLSRQYHCVVTNPPYLGNRGMNDKLRAYVEEFYSNSKIDLFASFMERELSFLKVNGIASLINQHSWMFLNSFLELRNLVIRDSTINSLLHLGPRTFPEISGEVVQSVAITFSKCQLAVNFGNYFRLINTKSSEEKEQQFLHRSNQYIVNQNDFLLITGCPFAYWASKKTLKIFNEFDPLKKYAPTKVGQNTGDNSLYLRYWFEVENKKFTKNLKADFNLESGNYKWLPYRKGGGFRKWAGNMELVVNWEDNGQSIKDFAVKRNKGKHWSRYIQNLNYNLKQGLSWSFISSNNFGARIANEGAIFDVQGSTAFPLDLSKTNYLLGLLNSSVGFHFLQIINPTLSFQTGNIAIIPAKISEKHLYLIENLVQEAVEISEKDWNRVETSWGFTPSNLFNNLEYKLLKHFTESYVETWRNNFYALKRIETEINKLFCEIYELEAEVSTEVSYENITIIDELKKCIIYNESDQYPEIILQILSFSICCMFGRYSLDKSDLILANQGENLYDFLQQVPSPSFIPDEDNIIPVLEGEWFTDDIVGRFKAFLKVAFGEEHFEENLKYIEDTIGKDIRKYFVKDFYNDHIKRYKKRPIYWMFSSPKGHFKALIYMHRYQPDLCSKMLTDYLQSYTHKLEAAQQNKIAESLREDLPARDKTAATKEADRYSAMIKDCKEYAQTLYAVATKKITIDLDDGVKVNYQKFKEVLVPIKGLEKEEE
jgi:hypothetical protein